MTQCLTPISFAIAVDTCPKLLPFVKRDLQARRLLDLFIGLKLEALIGNVSAREAEAKVWCGSPDIFDKET
jgi:hypothetical protein